MMPDVHALTGAYVLDAVPELERAAFERHLAECDACAQEVRELRETATRLGRAAAAEPPPQLRNRVLATIATVRQVPPDTGTGRRARSGAPRWALRLTSAAAAVLLVATATLGVLLVREQNARDDLRQYAGSLSSILQAGDVRVVSMPVTRGGSGAVLVSEQQNRALLIASDLPDPGEGKVYQAWLRDADDSMRSAGLMPAATATQARLVEMNGIGSAKGVGISIEPTGGSQTPTDVIMDLPFPA